MANDVSGILRDMTTTITLQLPDTIYQRAQRIAHAQKIDLHDLLVRSIVLEPKRFTGQDANIGREESVFRALHSQLMQTHFGQYVAITNGKWVDSDSDQVQLYRRIQRDYPNQFVLIALVKSNPKEEIVVRSPRLKQSI